MLVKFSQFQRWRFVMEALVKVSYGDEWRRSHDLAVRLLGGCGDGERGVHGVDLGSVCG